MDKTLDALNLYFKTLIVISATILVVAAGQIAAESNRVDDQISALNQMDTAYKQLSVTISADATTKYQQMFLDAVPSAQRDLRTSLNRMEFIPVAVQARQSTVGPELTLPLVTKRQPVSIWQMTQLFGWSYVTANYPSIVFTPENVRNLLKRVEADAHPLLQSGDLLVVVIPPEPGSGGLCSLAFESDTWDRQPFIPTLPCEVKGLVDVAPNLAKFIPSTIPVAMIDGRLVGLTPVDAVAKLQKSASSPPSQDTVDFGGPKLDAKLALQVGPFLIVVLLLLMVGLQSTVKLLSQRNPNDGNGGFWFGQFLGLTGLVMFVPIVLLPTAASLIAAGRGNLLGLNDRTWEAVTAAVFTLVLATIVYLSNRRAARDWESRLRPPAVSYSVLKEGGPG